LRIGIDVRPLAAPLTGIGIYVRELLRQLAELAPENDYFCYTSRGGERVARHLPPGNFHLRVGRGLSSLWGTLWFQSGAAKLIAKEKLDLFWGTNHILPLSLASRLPLVVTCHGLGFHLHPETLSRRNRLLLERYAVPSFRAADAILSVSRSTAGELSDAYGIDKGKIHVIHNAPARRFRPIDPEVTGNQLRQWFVLEPDYLLFVGTREPSKNLEGLLRALAQVQIHGDFDGEVVIVGGKGWRQKRAASLVEGHPLAGRIHLTGFVPHEELPLLYCGARLFAMPSLYEGFGIPVLEAMSCGVPVICSDSGALPEVAGDAARIVPRGDDQALARAITDLWNDAEERAAMRERGFRHASEFTWQRAARQLIEVFTRLAGDS
jgi:glycosyltransferase involved in cell wall biosynthesis